jgi:oxygen-dependent protoporphyrinogen oxidase
MRIAVIGGGIAGLAAAYRTAKLFSDLNKPLELSVFEAGSRLGGIIETLEGDDYLVEMGPDSFTTLKPAAIDLCREIGLKGKLISTNKDNRRAFIARGGVLNAIPKGFVMLAPNQYDTFFESNILSKTGKLRMAIEQFIAPIATIAEDESVASFVRRRFGPEAVDSIAQPMMGGIYTSDITKLSLRATMPKFLDYEQKYGSVAAGLRREERESKRTNQAIAESTSPATDIASTSHVAESGGARYSAFVSFDRGMQVLPNHLAELIGRKNIYCNSSVDSLSRVPEGWSIDLATGGSLIFDQVILAVPTAVASQLLKSVDGAASDLLSRIRYASSAVACIIVDRAQITHPLDGFGFVVPAKENRSILACSFSSVKFAGRCSDDKIILRIFMGGELDPQMWQLPDHELLEMALRDLNFYLGLSGVPERHWVKRWPQSMPQYEVGHLTLVRSIEQALSRLKGVHYAGAGLHGIGIPDCIASGESAARSVVL